MKKSHGTHLLSVWVAGGLQTSTSAKGLSDSLPKAEIDKYLKESFEYFMADNSGSVDLSCYMIGGRKKLGNEGVKETELFLPDEFYNKNLPSQVTPGTKYLPKYDEVGNIKQIKMYDDYGREIGWVDYTNHGYGNVHSSHYHTMPHWHEKTYNEQYPDGIKINHRTDINTPLGDK